MRLIKWLGTVSGRGSYSTHSFDPGSFAMPVDAEGHIDPNEDTRLPSERMGAHRPLIVAPVNPKASILAVGAKRG